ncbi:MAG: hypothetical protein CXZ00_08050 [Acidobacteria bacterium]|nr:MAG: hypothetical protein CXZ00_08050 [Acidobacteriota bacterium]
MRWAYLLLFAVVIVLAGSGQAQRGGHFGGNRGASMGTHRHHGFRNGVRGGHSRRFRDFGYGYGYFPWWWGEPFEYNEPEVAAPALPPPPVIVLSNGERQSRVPEIPAASPKLIEVPGAANTSTLKAQTAVFILRDGQRLEAASYMLTSNSLRVTVDREQRVIPISELDLNATVAANRERGIQLRIPAAPNEISLSF